MQGPNEHRRVAISKSVAAVPPRSSPLKAQAQAESLGSSVPHQIPVMAQRSNLSTFAVTVPVQVVMTLAHHCPATSRFSGVDRY